MRRWDLLLRKSARPRRAATQWRPLDVQSGGSYGILVALSGLVLVVAVALILGASIGSVIGLTLIYIGWTLFTAALRDWDVFMEAPVVRDATRPIGRRKGDYVWMAVGLLVVLLGVLVMLHVVEL